MMDLATDRFPSWRGRRLRAGLWACLSLCAAMLGWAQPTEQGSSAEARTAGGASVPAARQADRVAVITIREEITAVTASSVLRRMNEAIAGGADAIVFDIDTPGGEVTAVLEICAAIKASSIANTVAWINPQAYSGGAIIALACREIVVAESSSFGDALPIAIGLGGAQTATSGDLRKKVVPPVLAEVVDSARLRGWDEFLVQAIVIDGVELWLVERTDPDSGRRVRVAISEAEFRTLFPGQEPPRGSPMVVAASTVSAGSPTDSAPAPVRPAQPSDPTSFRPAAPSLQDLSPTLSGEASADTARDLDMLASASGRPVFTASDAGLWSLVGYLTNGSGPIVMKTREMRELGFASAVIRSDEELRAFFGAQTIVRLDRNWSESAVRVLSKFWVRGLLIVVFLLAMFIEMSSPGLILPGLTAFAALVLLMAPAWMLGLAGWWEVVAIGAGIALILTEILVLPGFGVFGVLGLAALFAGLVGSFVGPSSGIFPSAPQQQNELLRGLVTVILALITSAAGMSVLAKQFGKLPVIGKLVLDASATADDEVDDEQLFAAIDDRQPLERLMGQPGTAATPLLPSGRVEVAGEFYDAKSGLGSIDAGEPIRVVGVETWQLIVERDRPSEGTG
ncbi:MAG: NfeD family protein [Phycisphaerales bacterium]